MNEKNDPNVQVIENATRDDVRPGDHVVWEESDTERGVTSIIHREGVAHDRDSQGDWCTEEGLYITAGEGEDVTLTIRRTVKELPTKPGVVIVPAGGHKRIMAEEDGETWSARDAVLSWDGRWYGVWRSGDETHTFVARSGITPDTWKVDSQ